MSTTITVRIARVYGRDQIYPVCLSLDEDQKMSALKQCLAYAVDAIDSGSYSTALRSLSWYWDTRSNGSPACEESNWGQLYNSDDHALSLLDVVHAGLQARVKPLLSE